MAKKLTPIMGCNLVPKDLLSGRNPLKNYVILANELILDVIDGEKSAADVLR